MAKTNHIWFWQDKGYINYVYFSGVNLLIGTDSGLMLLDRSGQGKGIVSNHISSCLFQRKCSTIVIIRLLSWLYINTYSAVTQKRLKDINTKLEILAYTITVYSLIDLYNYSVLIN